MPVAQPLVVHRPGRTAEHGEAGPVGAIHERQQRHGHRDRQPDEETEHEDAGEAQDSDDEIGVVAPPEPAQRLDVE
jgi:hypothetical protein